MVRDRPDQYLDVIGRSFKWSRDDTKGRARERPPVEPAGERRVLLRRDRRSGQLRGHLPVGVLAYGSDLIKDPPDASRFANLAALQTIDKSGIFKDQKVAIAPIRSGGGASLEADPLLSKDIRFLFEPNSATLDMANQENIKNLEAIKKLLQVSPGSTLLLRGHVDNAKVEEFRNKGGEALRPFDGAARDVAQQGPRRRRIASCSIERYSIDAKRIEIVGRGWEEPAGPNSDQNRRVEVQWFTIE